MTDDKTRQLENRIETLESTIEKMMPSRRDALKMGGAALAGGSLMAGSASAGTNQVGTIGSPSELVDIESEDINNTDTITTDTLDSTTVDNSGTVTTQDLVVNGTATGPFGGGAPVLEAGDTITVETISLEVTNRAFFTLYNGTAKDVIGGIMSGHKTLDFIYTFQNGNTLRKNGSGTSYNRAFESIGKDSSGDAYEVDFLPPALDVTKIEVAGDDFGSTELGAEVILKD
jgi:hypothetical protein